LGRRLQKGFGEVPMLINGRTEMVKIGIELVTIDGFSGHSDRRQLLDFVDQMSPHAQGDRLPPRGLPQVQRTWKDAAGALPLPHVRAEEP